MTLFRSKRKLLEIGFNRPLALQRSVDFSRRDLYVLILVNQVQAIILPGNWQSAWQ
jgi:hypothetical protein